MHCATFTQCLSNSVEGCVCMFVPGAGNPPPGRSLSHFACAAAELLGIALKPPLGPGSGKLGTPLARMQSANFSSSRRNCAGVDGEAELASPLPAGTFDPEVAVPPRFA